MLRHCKFICIVPLHYWPQESKPGKVPSTVPVQCSAMAVGGGYGAREESQAPFDTTAFQKCNTGVSGSCSCPSIFKLMQLNQYKFLHACLLCPDLFQSNQKKMRVYSYIFFFLEIIHIHFRVWPSLSGLAPRAMFPLVSIWVQEEKRRVQLL